MIKLSLCIPTYNRGRFISKTIKSIIDQATDEVEIVVSDNASEDDTSEVVENFRKNFPRIKYFCWDQNMGADRNFLKVVELARGEYCWFLGSDDRIELGAIEYVLNALNNNQSLSGISVNFQAYDKDLDHVIPSGPLGDGSLKRDLLFQESDTAFSVLGAYFGYLSGQIVQRSIWLEIVRKNDVSKFMNAYVHVYIIGKMLISHPKWLYLHRECVGWRSGNDSFLKNGRLKRLSLDIFGYEIIVRSLFGGKSTTYNAVLKTVATTHVRYAILGAKIHNESMGFFMQAFFYCIKFYRKYTVFWIKTFPLFLLPRPFVLLLRAIYRITLKPRQIKNLSNPNSVHL